MTRTRTRSSRSRRRPGTGRAPQQQASGGNAPPRAAPGLPEDYAERAERLVADAGGVLGEMVAWMDRTAKYPQPELFLGASVAALGALTGREYRSGRAGHPRQRAGAGAGPVGRRQGPRAQMRNEGPRGGRPYAEYNLGQNIASAEGLLAGLGNFFAGISLIDEFGLFLDAAANPHAPPYLKGIVRLMMELFSSATGLYRDRLRAEHRDANTVRHDVPEPCWCLVGTTVPENFWSALSSRRRPTAFWPGFCS